MGLFDGYFDPQQWPDSGGLLSRLLALQQQQGQDQPDPSSDQSLSVPEVPGPMPTWSPMLANFGQMPSAPQKSQNASPARNLGDDNAMLATVNPEIAKALIAPGLAGQKGFGNTGDADPSGNGFADPDHEASSMAGGQPSGLSQAAYRETPANANQAAGELQSIQQANEKNMVVGTDYLSGVREGNVKRNSDGSLDVTNGTVLTYSNNDGHAKTVTVTNTDIAHIDPKTGVVTQKSSLDDGI